MAAVIGAFWWIAAMALIVLAAGFSTLSANTLGFVNVSHHDLLNVHRCFIAHFVALGCWG